MKKCVKCVLCKNVIEANDLHQEPKKDREGNIKCTMKGATQMNNYHLSCYNKNKIENQQWSELYEYLKEIYFNKILCTSLINQLRDLRKYFNYNIMRECFENLEPKIYTRVNSINFENDAKKGSYLMAILKNNIDGFSKKQQEPIREPIKDPITTQRVIENSANNITTTYQIPKSKNIFDFID